MLQIFLFLQVRVYFDYDKFVDVATQYHDDADEVNRTLQHFYNNAHKLEDTMETTDGEGHSYDAICRYQGKEYCTYLSWDYQAFEGVSYKMQAAEDIYKQLSSNKN